MGKYRPKGKDKQRRDRGEQDERDDADNAKMENANFEAYYRAQGILDDSEWAICLEYFRRGLPSAFRISPSRAASASLNRLLIEQYVPKMKQVEVAQQDLDSVGVKAIKLPEQLPWYPDGLAWQFDLPRKVLKKFEDFKKFHQFLIYETEVGNISRQESVSMIPPLFLSVQPGDKVLDMCAAPGSKTAQLLEALHAAPISTEDHKINPTSPGLLIANDADLKRAHLLIHQSARIPSDKFMVTNLDASSFPWLSLGENSGQTDRKLRFDKILCDVPCSGDGTLRKNPGIWRTWNVGNGNGLHSVQRRILCRAMSILSHNPDARIVYSTCTMNPIENEAVIASALNSYAGFELEDVGSHLPELLRRPGIQTWTPFPSNSGGANRPSFNWRSWNEYHEQRVRRSTDGKPEVSIPAYVQSKEKLLSSMFPPNNVSELGLHKCMRFYPHMMDSGGFFVAVLRRKHSQVQPQGKKPLIRKQEDVAEKLEELPAKRPKFETDAIEASVTEDTAESMVVAVNELSEEEITNDKPVQGFKEPAFIFLPAEHPSIVTLREKDMFSPSFPYPNLFLHTAPPQPGSTVLQLPARSLYLANSVVKALIENNDYIRMRLVAAGTKVLNRQEKDGTHFRMMDEGLEALLPYIRDGDVVEGNLEDLRVLLAEYAPFFNKLKEGPFTDSLANRPQGNIIARFRTHLDDTKDLQPLILPAWRSQVSVTLMVNKKIKSSLSLRFFGEDITPQGTKTVEIPAEGVAAIPAER